MNIKKLVQVSLPLSAIALVALLPACGGSVEFDTCSSVKVGDTRSDVDSKLGSAVSVTPGGNGSFAVGRYESEKDGVVSCCIVKLTGEADEAVAIAQPEYQPVCK